jgi:UDP:flavonoid glycosyltransferase YjiC (YdhE family)
VNRHRKRILFLAEGITMAHFTRPAVLAESLDPDEFEVVFRTPRRFHQLLRSTISDVDDLRTLDPAAFLDCLANGGVLYKGDTLRGYVEDELRILKEVAPDLVIGDYRMSLCVSAPKSGVPFASIFNAYWSHFGKQPAVVPEIPATRWISPRFLNPVYAVTRPMFYAYHARPLNRLRSAYGFRPLGPDIRLYYTTGDLVLYPDVPELVPLAGLPAHHRFVGPCLWSATVAKPAWWNEVFESPGPKVFVALGSSGPIKALPAILKALETLGVTAVLATSGRPIGATGPNVYTADLLPFDETARRSALIVSHGGSSGIYPALAAGIPVLALPGNIDTHLSSAVLEASGGGLQVRIEQASVGTLSDAMQRIMDEAAFKESAKQWAAVMAAHDSQRIFPALLREWFDQRS